MENRVEPGQCPKCKGMNLDYGDMALTGDSAYCPFVCLDCEATGNEWFNLEYTESVLDDE